MGSVISWLKQNRVVVVVSLAAIVAAYGFGRYAAPTKTVETDISRTFAGWDWRQNVVTVKGPVRVVTKRVEVPGPAGPTVTIERVVTRDPVTTTTGTAGSGLQGTERVVEKIVERKAPAVALFGTVGLGFNGGMSPPMYGLGATVRIAGPITVFGQGEAGPGGGSARVGLGISF